MVKAKVNVKRTGAGTTEKESKKGNSLLGNIFKSLAPLAVLAALKPIAHLIELIFAFAGLTVLLLIKWFGKLIDYLGELFPILWEKIGEWSGKIIDKIVKWVGSLKDKIVVWLNLVVNWLKGLPERIGTFLKELPGKIWEFMSGLPEAFSIAIGLVTTKIGELWETLKEKLPFLQTIEDVITDVWDVLKTLPADIWEFMTALPKMVWEFQKALPKHIWEFIKQLPSLIWDFMKKLPSLIGSAIKGCLPDWMKGDKKESEPTTTSVGDAIIRPNGDIIRTHPNDTLIATQTPNAVGSSTVFNFYGLTMDEALEKVRQEFGADKMRASRF